jgi:hypothetical protein
MKNLSDPVLALLFALVLTFVDRLFISGPYMGLAGIALSVIAALAGWYAARAGSVLLPNNKRAGIGQYSSAPVFVFALLAAAIFIAFAYVKLFDMTKVDYTATDVAWHLGLVALASFTIRMAGSSVEALR